jgi:alpha-glucosidase
VRRPSEILRFWFDRGVAGFRIDVAHGLYKDAQLRDDPPVPEGGMIGGRFGLAQIYSANRPESHGVFRDWRKIAESYPVPRVLLGETWVGDVGALAAFHGQGDELQLTFNFPGLRPVSGSWPPWCRVAGQAARR